MNACQEHLVKCMLKFNRGVKMYRRIKELREDNDLLQKQVAITLK